MPVKNSIAPIPLTSVSATTFDGTTYVPINPGGVPQPLFLYTIINDSSSDLIVSYDGVTAHDFIAAGSTSVNPIQYNSQPNTYIANLARGTVIWVKGAMGTGEVYLSGFYQPQA